MYLSLEQNKSPNIISPRQNCFISLIISNTSTLRDAVYIRAVSNRNPFIVNTSSLTLPSIHVSRNSTIYIHSSRDNVAVAADKFLPSTPTILASSRYARAVGRQWGGEGFAAFRDRSTRGRINLNSHYWREARRDTRLRSDT